MIFLLFFLNSFSKNKISTIFFNHIFYMTFFWAYVICALTGALKIGVLPILIPIILQVNVLFLILLSNLSLS